MKYYAIDRLLDNEIVNRLSVLGRAVLTLREAPHQFFPLAGLLKLVPDEIEIDADDEDYQNQPYSEEYSLCRKEQGEEQHYKREQIEDNPCLYFIGVHTNTILIF